jgi:hypothetical protein
MSGISHFWILVIRATVLVMLGINLYYRSQSAYLPQGVL